MVSRALLMARVLRAAPSAKGRRLGRRGYEPASRRRRQRGQRRADTFECGLFVPKARGLKVLNSRVRIGLFGLVLLGSLSGATADLMRHHIGGAESVDVRHGHAELPGSCPEHGHRCDLGVPLTGPKLLARTLASPAQDEPIRAAAAPAGRLAGDDESSIRLPRTRAPPPLV